MKFTLVLVATLFSAAPAHAGLLWGYATGMCGLSATCQIGAMQRRNQDEANRLREERRQREEADPSLFNHTPENRK